MIRHQQRLELDQREDGAVERDVDGHEDLDLERIGRAPSLIAYLNELKSNRLNNRAKCNRLIGADVVVVLERGAAFIAALVQLLFLGRVSLNIKKKKFNYLIELNINNSVN